MKDRKWLIFKYQESTEKRELQEGHQNDLENNVQTGKGDKE